MGEYDVAGLFFTTALSLRPRTGQGFCASRSRWPPRAPRSSTARPWPGRDTAVIRRAAVNGAETPCDRGEPRATRRCQPLSSVYNNVQPASPRTACDSGCWTSVVC